MEHPRLKPCRDVVDGGDSSPDLRSEPRTFVIHESRPKKGPFGAEAFCDVGKGREEGYGG